MSIFHQQHQNAPDPKKPRQQDVRSEVEGEESINNQSDIPITNSDDMLPPDTFEDSPSEEDEDERLNNLRDALNSDDLPLPPDERGEDITN